MAVISVRVEKSGRVLIPAAIRRRLGLKEGESDLLLNIDETPIRVSTRAQALARVRQALAKYHKPGDDWTAELIAERREEARREEEGE
jgi:AbrB family looped-hinge helix DNA binding protein